MFPSLKVCVRIQDGSKVFQILRRSQASLAVSSEAVKDFHEIPSPPSWPLIGHTIPFMKHGDRLDKYAAGLQAQYGDMIRLRFPAGSGNMSMVMLFKPQHAKTMYAEEERIPKLPGFDVFEYSRGVDLRSRFTSKGLITNSEEWYDVRSQVQQDMMRPKSALYYISDLEKIALDVTEVIEKESDQTGTLDVVKICQKYALEAVANIFLGSRLGTLSGKGDGQRLIEISDVIGPTSQKLIFLPLWLLPYLPEYKKWITYLEEAFDICNKHVTNAKANSTEESETIIAKLGRRCGSDSVIPTVMAIDALMAGIDTTGTAAAFLLYHLATNPDKQENLYQEICDTIGPSGHLTESDLAKMRYMKAVQMESQRIQPSVWGTSRMFDKDLIINGYKIPAGTTVVRVGAFSSMDPENFREPEKFLPERWLRNHPDRHTADSFANLPFGHGARSCIGQRFARLELFMLMMKLVQTFRLEYSGTEQVGVLTKFVSVPDKPVRIKFIRRN